MMAAPRRPRSPTAVVRRMVAAAIVSVTLGLVVGLQACATTAVPSASGGGSNIASSPVSSSGSSRSPSEAAIGTFWPESVPRAVVGLGAGDNEIRKAGVDMGAAVATQDLVRMRNVADGLAKLADGLLPFARQLAAYPPFADIGNRAVTSMTHLRDGSVELRTAIEAGDSTRIVTASTAIGDALEEYGTIRARLSALVPEALRQQKALVK